MPHITIEVSPTLTDFDASRTLERVNHVLAASGQFDDADIKTRVLRLHEALVGTEGAAQGFVHATLRLLSGRSPATRAALSASVLEALLGSLPAAGGMQRPVQVSVDVVEMDRSTYAKQVVVS